MKGNANNPTVLDAGVLIALALGETSAANLSDRIVKQHGSYACTEIALCELSYILCRHTSWERAWDKTQNLIQSSTVIVVPSHVLWAEAARLKCSVPIALPDCFSIAAARLLKGKVIFTRKEKEIAHAIENKGLNDRIEFLE